VVEGSVREVGLGGRGSGTGWLVKADNWGSSSAGKFAESSGSDRVVGTTPAWDSTAEGVKESSCDPTACVVAVVDTPPNPEASYSNAGELMEVD
jgi:hypothetical protein